MCNKEDMDLQKKLIRSVSLFLILSLVLSVPAFAMDARASERFKRYSSNLYAENDGSIYVLFSVTATTTMDVIGASSIAIQRYDNARWVTECTLTVTDEPSMQTTKAAQYAASIPYEPLFSNMEYRAVITFYAKDSSGSSTAKMTSGTVTT